VHQARVDGGDANYNEAASICSAAYNTARHGVAAASQSVFDDVGQMFNYRVHEQQVNGSTRDTPVPPRRPIMKRHGTLRGRRDSDSDAASAFSCISIHDALSSNGVSFCGKHASLILYIYPVGNLSH